MKILHIYKTYYPETLGGIECVIQNISRELSNKKVTASVVVCSKQATRIERFDQNQVYYFRQNCEIASCPISLAMLLQFKKIAQQYDLLHYHFPWPFADFIHLALQIKKPTVISYHSDIVRQVLLKRMYTPLMKLFLQQANRIVASSPNLLRTSELLQHYQSKVEVIPYGIDQNQYPTPTLDEINNWKKVVGSDFFLFIGVLRYYKGLDYLLEAVRGTDIPVVIAGSGPERDKLQAFVEKYEMRNVLFLGRISQEAKMALLYLCKAVVAPSHLRAEAYCMSLLEGLMVGKPIISTELGTGTSYVNKSGFSGLVVSPSDAMQLRQAMLHMLHDNNDYANFQLGAKAHFKAHFSAATMGESYLKVYEELLA